MMMMTRTPASLSATSLAGTALLALFVLAGCSPVVVPGDESQPKDVGEVALDDADGGVEGDDPKEDVQEMPETHAEVAEDLDQDDDGVEDAEDNCPAAENPEQEDLDGDGDGDVCDDDEDGDGVVDQNDNCPRHPNTAQEDCDGDGKGDACVADDDGDGLGDACDDCSDDADDDTVCDTEDNCPTTMNPGQVDTDQDGLGDVCDDCPEDASNDVDEDGYCAGDDNCPSASNPGQQDSDGDGQGDICEDDCDGDTVLDPDDNCVCEPNDGQSNVDGDALGDACDPDADGDGLLGGVDDCDDLSASVLGCTQWYPDEDEDLHGAGQSSTVCECFKPEGSWSDNALDCDDGDKKISPLATELCDGVDNDCDGVTDPGEPDLDQDGNADCIDDDLDGDGVANAEDNCELKHNPEQVSSDDDGAGDACDADDDDDGIPDPLSLLACLEQKCPSQLSACLAEAPCVPENTDVTCGDGIDNDCDGSVDCASETCSKNPAVTVCGGFTAAESSPEACADGDDNDGNGLTDCNDWGCRYNSDTNCDYSHPVSCGQATACIQDCEEVSGECTDACLEDAQSGNLTSAKATLLSCALSSECLASEGGQGDNCPTTPNPDQADQDGNGIGDACDGDQDGDGVLTDGDASGVPGDAPCVDGETEGCDDSCPHTPNSGQGNYDGDALGDACDSDDDDDGDPDHTDCAPFDATIHQGATEVCDEVDRDCNALVDDGVGLTGCTDWLLDQDDDGFGVTGDSQCTCEPAGFHRALEGGDCDDGNVLIHPDATEQCNTVDDDCNGVADDGFDLDGLPIGAPCDGDQDEDDLSDGQVICQTNTTLVCPPWPCIKKTTYTGEVVCKDASGTEGCALEVCDGIDNDCDGVADEDWQEGGSKAGSSWLGKICDGGDPDQCKNGKLACNGSTAGGEPVCMSDIPAPPESCNNQDDDCDGKVDEGCDDDGDGYCDKNMSVLTAACPKGIDCNDAKKSIHPGADELCNDVDDDCNGEVDDDPVSSSWPKGEEEPNNSFVFATELFETNVTYWSTWTSGARLPGSPADSDDWYVIDRYYNPSSTGWPPKYFKCKLSGMPPNMQVKLKVGSGVPGHETYSPTLGVTNNQWISVYNFQSGVAVPGTWRFYAHVSDPSGVVPRCDATYQLNCRVSNLK